MPWPNWLKQKRCYGASISFSQHVLNKTLIDFLVNMSASADVLAQAKVEVPLNSIPEGKNVSSAIPPDIDFPLRQCFTRPLLTTS